VFSSFVKPQSRYTAGLASFGGERGMIPGPRLRYGARFCSASSVEQGLCLGAAPLTISIFISHMLTGPFETKEGFRGESA
jgi:hypothetical protein